MYYILYAAIFGGVKVDIYVFDRSLNFIGNADKFTSLQWIRRYHQAGKFELHCPITIDTIDIFKKNNLIWIQGSDEVGIIQYRNLSTDETGKEALKIIGKFYTSILDRRVMYNTEQYINKNAEIIMRNIVDNNAINAIQGRELPILLGQLNNFSNKIDYQKSYGNVLEELNTISETTDMGFYIRTDLEGKKHYFETYKGIDRTINQDKNSHVVFSRDNDNLKNQEYTDSNDNLRTTAIVAGEGGGAERTVITVNNDYTGIDRYELFVDARDLQRENDGVIMPENEYKDLLRQRGLEKLAEHKEIETFEGKVETNNYIYKEDFDLGDIVTVMDKKWNVTVDTRITEINEIYENGNVSIVPTLGNKIPTILDKIKRM